MSDLASYGSKGKSVELTQETLTSELFNFVNTESKDVELIYIGRETRLISFGVMETLPIIRLTNFNYLTNKGDKKRTKKDLDTQFNAAMSKLEFNVEVGTIAYIKTPKQFYFVCGESKRAWVLTKEEILEQGLEVSDRFKPFWEAKKAPRPSFTASVKVDF